MSFSGIVVNALACHAGGPGSIHGLSNYSNYFFFLLLLQFWPLKMILTTRVYQLESNPLGCTFISRFLNLPSKLCSITLNVQLFDISEQHFSRLRKFMDRRKFSGSQKKRSYCRGKFSIIPKFSFTKVLM